MFLMKSLGKLMWGEKSELVQVCGRLERDGSLLFGSSTAVVKRMSQPHTFSLILTKLSPVHDGDEEGQEGVGDDESNELTFFIAPEMNFWSEADGKTFLWQDSLHSSTFKFVADDSPTNTVALIQLFELTILQSMFEWINKTSAEEASEEQLVALKRSVFSLPLHTSYTLSLTHTHTHCPFN